jgi:hypothetical protein
MARCGKIRRRWFLFHYYLRGTAIFSSRTEASHISNYGIWQQRNKTHDNGELLGADCNLGLPLSVRCADMFGVAEAETRP